MSNDPYAAPSADLHSNDAAIQTSPWTAKGRLSRLAYLGQSLLLLLAMGLVLAALVIALIVTIGGPANAANMFENLENLEDTEFLGILPVLPLLGILILLLVTTYLSTCLLIKRLHDRDHSGWWSLPLFLVSMIPVLGFITIIPYLYLVCWPGQKQANRFGGQRTTKGWEKILGILFIIILAIPVIALLVFGGTSFLEVGALGS